MYTLQVAVSLRPPPVAWPCSTGTDKSRARGKGLLGPTRVLPSSLPLQDLNKRLSLPMDIRLPQEFLQKLQLENPGLPKPLTRMSRRASLVSPRRVSVGCWLSGRHQCGLSTTGLVHPG